MNRVFLNVLFTIPVILIILVAAIHISQLRSSQYFSGDGTSIAVQSLRANYGDEGIYAGQHQFKDYWARDGFFASLGALALGDTEIVRKNLELFESYQQEDGQLPLRVGQKNVFLKLIGISKEEQVPVYVEDKVENVPLDQNCLYIIAADAYLEKTKEDPSLFLSSMRKAFTWLNAKDTDGNHLVEEHAYGGWTDSLQKEGEVLYTNVCYATSARVLAKYDSGYAQKADAIQSAINKEFWNENYYVDVVGTTYFSTEANLLAIYWDVANTTQSEKILSFVDEAGIRSDAGILNSNEPYPLSMKNTGIVLVGMQGYHDQMYWLWISAVDVLANAKVGNTEQALAILQTMDTLMEEHHTVYEVTLEDKQPFYNVVYRSEEPFAWSAGMYLLANSQLRE